MAFQNVQSFYDGGFAWGLGTVNIAAGAAGNNPVTAPGTPVRATRLVRDQDNAPPVAAEDTFSAMTLDDQDILLVINPANPNFPSQGCYPDSVVSPDLGFVALRDSALTITRNNGGGGAWNAQAGIRCAVANPNPNLGVEGSTLEGVQDTGRGRFLGLGASANPGDTKTGTPLSARDLLLYHLVISTNDDSLECATVQIDDYDYVTGGALPSGFFAADCPQFSFRGARVTKSNTITVTTQNAAGGTLHCEGITAQVV